MAGCTGIFTHQLPSPSSISDPVLIMSMKVRCKAYDELLCYRSVQRYRKHDRIIDFGRCEVCVDGLYSDRLL
jgi:hypothetical protein